LEYHGKNNWGPNQWIVRVKITPRLLKIHLAFLNKSSWILDGLSVNEWLTRLDRPPLKQEPEEGNRKPPQYCPTLPPHHGKPFHEKPAFGQNTPIPIYCTTLW